MHPLILLQGTCNIVNYGGESKSLLAKDLKEGRKMIELIIICKREFFHLIEKKYYF
jgi:hypothetical protein